MTPTARQNAENLDLPSTASRNINGTATLGSSLVVS